MFREKGPWCMVMSCRGAFWYHVALSCPGRCNLLQWVHSHLWGAFRAFLGSLMTHSVDSKTPLISHKEFRGKKEIEQTKNERGSVWSVTRDFLLYIICSETLGRHIAGTSAGVYHMWVQLRSKSRKNPDWCLDCAVTKSFLVLLMILLHEALFFQMVN